MNNLSQQIKELRETIQYISLHLRVADLQAKVAELDQEIRQKKQGTSLEALQDRLRKLEEQQENMIRILSNTLPPS
jgi:hypothetical protein